MTGIKIMLSSGFTDTTLPILYDDPIISNGSLILVDPIHSANPLASGVPANNALIPNIAWGTAKALVGSGDINSLACIFKDNHQAADALFQRTSKGALHGIFSQVNNTNSTRGVEVAAQTLLQTYLLANRGHRFYLSTWGRRTRVAITTGGAQPRVAMLADYGSGANYIMNQDTSGQVAHSGLGSRLTPGANVTGNFFRNADGSDYSVGAPSSAANVAATMFGWGNFTPGHVAWENKGASDIMYRSYLEDLTVSGRTYAQVDAIDYALWQAAFAAGGRYYGDTFTDPATFA